MHTGGLTSRRTDFRVCSGHSKGHKRGPAAPGRFLRCRDSPGKDWHMGVRAGLPGDRSAPSRELSWETMSPGTQGGSPAALPWTPPRATASLWCKKPRADFRRPRHAGPGDRPSHPHPTTTQARPSWATAARSYRSLHRDVLELVSRTPRTHLIPSFPGFPLTTALQPKAPCDRIPALSSSLRSPQSPLRGLARLSLAAEPLTSGFPSQDHSAP